MLRSIVRARLADLLAARRRAWTAVRCEAEAADGELATVAARLAALERRVESHAPFRAEMTIDAAWHRHPGAPGVFARHHLPACDGCAVRLDETLAEAAGAYGIDVGRLLADLCALVEESGSTGPPAGPIREERPTRGPSGYTVESPPRTEQG